MTPEMAKRVEFLREAAARGYAVQWAMGELKLSRAVVRQTCYYYGINMKSAQKLHAKMQKIQKAGTAWPLPVEASDYEDFLPDVGEV